MQKKLLEYWKEPIKDQDKRRLSMKYISIIFLFFTLTTIGNCQEWVHYEPKIPVIEIQQNPVQSFSTSQIYVYRPVIYQWVPQIVNEPVIVEHKTIFCTKTTIVYRPTIRWTYQLSYIQ